MNRFSSLEFDDAHPSGSERPRGEPIRDEAYYCQEAMRCWLAADFELALRNFSRCLEANSGFFAGWTGQVRMLIELGEYPEALVWSDKALELFPEHPELFAYKAIACFRDARFDKAMAYSDNAMANEQTNARVWLARAEVMMRSKKRISETCISKAITSAGTGLPVVRLEAGRVLAKYNLCSPALEYLGQAVRDFPKSPLAWYELGRCQVRLGFAEARTSLEQSLHLRPDWPPAQMEFKRAGRGGMFNRLMGRVLGR